MLTLHRVDWAGIIMGMKMERTEACPQYLPLEQLVKSMSAQWKSHIRSGPRTARERSNCQGLCFGVWAMASSL